MPSTPTTSLATSDAEIIEQLKQQLDVTSQRLQLSELRVQVLEDRLICQASEDLSPFDGEIEVDESYFGGKRKGMRGRGAAGKVPVFGLLKRGGKVCAKVIPDVKGKTLRAIMENKIVHDSIVYSDTFGSYNVLDISAFKHYRINHTRLFADRQTHINGIENFWNQAKRHMRKFNGVPKSHFPLF